MSSTTGSMKSWQWSQLRQGPARLVPFTRIASSLYERYIQPHSPFCSFHWASPTASLSAAGRSLLGTEHYVCVCVSMHELHLMCWLVHNLVQTASVPLHETGIHVSVFVQDDILGSQFQVCEVDFAETGMTTKSQESQFDASFSCQGCKAPPPAPPTPTAPAVPPSSK